MGADFLCSYFWCRNLYQQDNDDYRGDHKIVVQSVKMSLSRQDTAQYFWAANSVKI